MFEKAKHLAATPSRRYPKMNQLVNNHGTGLPSEVVFGFVYAVGTQSSPIKDQLEDELTQFGFEVHKIRLSDHFERHARKRNLKIDFPESPYDEKVASLMNAGNALCELIPDFVVSLAVSLISYFRSKAQAAGKPTRGRAYLISSLRRPEEVSLLREIYGRGFHLVGIYAPERERFMHLQFHESVGEDAARKLMTRDFDEKRTSGQKTSETFALADVYIPQDANSYRQHLRRFVDLVFANPFVTPTQDEQSMFMAFAASLRSGDLSRQVGAALTSNNGDLLGVGCNDVPAPGGGLYWPGPHDQRDYVRGADSNEKRRDEIIGELVGKLRNDANISPGKVRSLLEDLNWTEFDDLRNRALSDDTFAEEVAALFRNPDAVKPEVAKNMLRDTSLFSLTEFGRSVHAEMEALLSCARTGRSPVGANLHVTTFPCHNCTRHIVSAGVARVVYVEPYPKSLALRLHWDSIALKEQGGKPDEACGQHAKVLFEPFIGIGPRRYFDLFSMTLGAGSKVRRKQYRAKGEIEKWSRTNALLRVTLEDTSYLERENKAIAAIES